MSLRSTQENVLPPKLFNEKGELQRPASQFRNWISRSPGAKFPPEKGRYHLYVQYACPWAHRTLIARKLKGLESTISVTSVHHHMSTVDGWRFVTADEATTYSTSDKDNILTPDPLHPDFARLRDLYFLADPDYQGRFTVPVLWDKETETIVSNESSEIIRMLNSEFNDFASEEGRNVDLYPEGLREKIDEVNEWTYESINNGVYKCGMAQTQEAYNSAVTVLFAALDRVESHLSSSPTYFFNTPTPTECDIRLFVTMIRFDIVYVSLFKTNLYTIRQPNKYPNIHRWMRQLYWNVAAFGETTKFDDIKGHYFKSLTMLNPKGIVPEGPVPMIEGL